MDEIDKEDEQEPTTNHQGRSIPPSRLCFISPTYACSALVCILVVDILLD